MKTIYIGFNANNAIENDFSFDGSITIYPTSEKGNIYYSNTYLNDTSSNDFLDKYALFVKDTVSDMQKSDILQIICFNKKAVNLCKKIGIDDIISIKNEEIVELLNNKYKTRKLVDKIVPILDYKWIDSSQLDYKKISSLLNSNTFVLQKDSGAGGDSTYLINDDFQMKNMNLDDGIYCVSKYEKNIPINETLIIGDNEILHLPISVQLIKLIENKFKYVGGDFIYSQKLSNKIINKIIDYSDKIGKLVSSMGYRGILGIDYILNEKEQIFFMEINPRFQSSSFLISIYLKKYYNTDIANLHICAVRNEKLPSIKLERIDNSFVNCNEKNSYDNLDNYTKICKGYFSDNNSSVFRKIFDRSVLFEDEFEKYN